MVRDHRPCHRPRRRRHGGRRGRRAPAPPQGTHPTRTRGARAAAADYSLHAATRLDQSARHQPIHRHRPGHLRARRPRKEHPDMITNRTRHRATRTVDRPSTAARRPAAISSSAGTWPRCGLHTAAEAAAGRPRPSHHRRPVADRRAGAAARPRGRRHRGPPARRPAPVRLPAHPRHAWRTSTSTPPPASTGS